MRQRQAETKMTKRINGTIFFGRDAIRTQEEWKGTIVIGMFSSLR